MLRLSHRFVDFQHSPKGSYTTSPKPSNKSMITADKRKAVFLLHQEGMPIREISRGLKLSRNAVRRIIAQAGLMPRLVRPPVQVIDPDLLRQLHQECHGYAQRMAEKLREEHGIAIKYSTLTRHLRQLGIGTPVNIRCERGLPIIKKPDTIAISTKTATKAPTDCARRSCISQ